MPDIKCETSTLGLTGTISEHDRKLIDMSQVPAFYLNLLARYKVELVRPDDIQPSPENAEIYGIPRMDSDSAMPTLVRSIERLGLEQPLIVTRDGYILSGHRRYFALRYLGAEYIPVRFADVSRAENADYHRLLTQYNPQRVKSVATTLAEALLNKEHEDECVDSWGAYVAKRQQAPPSNLQVDGYKNAEPVGPRQQEFFQAVKAVVKSLSDYWPLSIRQIHYKLLNNPPLTQTTKRRNERWRYRNNLNSYNKLSGLLVAARYHFDISLAAIDDSTRETRVPVKGF